MICDDDSFDDGRATSTATVENVSITSYLSFVSTNLEMKRNDREMADRRMRSLPTIAIARGRGDRLSRTLLQKRRGRERSNVFCFVQG